MTVATGEGQRTGCVWIVSSDPDRNGSLEAHVRSGGEHPLRVSVAAALASSVDAERPADAILTDLDPAEPHARRVFERLLRGADFGGAPRVHILRDAETRRELERLDPLGALLALRRPAPASDVATRIRIAAGLGRALRRAHYRGAVDRATGAFERRYFLARVDEELARADRFGTAVSLVVFEIEADGDPATAIRETARALSKRCRRSDLLGRLGHRRFGIVLPGAPHRGAAVFANKVRSDVARRLAHPRRRGGVRLSAGVATAPDTTAATARAFVARAVAAAEEARERGGNRVYLDEATLRGDDRVVLLADRDREFLDAAEDLFAMDGFAVVRAASAEILAETLRFRTPDLAVLDLGLRTLRGASVTEALAVAGARCPIVGLAPDSASAPGDPGRDGIDRLLTKPVSVGALVAVARDLVVAS